jgi:hypothetical protein
MAKMSHLRSWQSRLCVVKCACPPAEAHVSAYLSPAIVLLRRQLTLAGACSALWRCAGALQEERAGGAAVEAASDLLSAVWCAVVNFPRLRHRMFQVLANHWSFLNIQSSMSVGPRAADISYDAENNVISKISRCVFVRESACPRMIVAAVQGLCRAHRLVLC